MKKFLFPLIFLFVSLNSFAIELAQTTATNLNVRSAPAGKIIFSLSKGSIVAIVKRGKEWTLISYFASNDKTDIKSGWVGSKYLSALEKQSKTSHGSTSISGDDCGYDYDSDSKACVTVGYTDFSCSESMFEPKYESCTLELSYDVESNYAGDDYINVDISCNAEFEYKEKDSYMWSSDYASETRDHTLWAYGSDSERIYLEVYFSSFNPVVQAKVSSLACTVENVYSY